MSKSIILGAYVKDAAGAHGWVCGQRSQSVWLVRWFDCRGVCVAHTAELSRISYKAVR